MAEELTKAQTARRVRELLLRYREKSDKKKGHVFVGPNGNPYTKDSVSQAFRRAAKKARIKNVRFHDLRTPLLRERRRQERRDPT